jgi:hypothetical protein
LNKILSHLRVCQAVEMRYFAYSRKIREECAYRRAGDCCPYTSEECVVYAIVVCRLLLSQRLAVRW